MHSKLLQALRQHEVMIPKHARVLLAVSGGQVCGCVLICSL